MRLLCSGGVRRALGDRGRGVCQWREEQQGKATREYSRVVEVGREGGREGEKE